MRERFWNKKLKKSSWHRLWFILVYGLLIGILWYCVRHEYFIFLFVTFIGFLFATIRSIVKEKQKEEGISTNNNKKIRDWLITYVINYPIAIFTSVSILYLIVKQLEGKELGGSVIFCFSIAMFLLVGFEIDSIFKQGSILDGILDFMGKIRNAIGRDFKKGEIGGNDQKSAKKK